MLYKNRKYKSWMDMTALIFNDIFPEMRTQLAVNNTFKQDGGGCNCSTITIAGWILNV